MNCPLFTIDGQLSLLDEISTEKQKLSHVAAKAPYAK
jgi:hypothetical protein